MKNLPPSDMILAGLFVHLSLSSLTRLLWTWGDGPTKADDCRFELDPNSIICKKNAISWVLLIALSLVVASVTAFKSGANKKDQWISSLLGSFLLNLSANNLGYIAISCSQQAYCDDTSRRLSDIYMLCSQSIIVLTAILVLIRFMKRKTPHATGLNTYRPDPEIILVGVCARIAVDKICYLVSGQEAYWQSCWRKFGVGGQLEFLVMSLLLATLTFVKTAKRYRFCRSFGTLIGSFTILFTFSLQSLSAEPEGIEYAVFSMVIFMMAAVWFTNIFVRKSPGSEDVPDQTPHYDPPPAYPSHCEALPSYSSEGPPPSYSTAINL